MTYRQFLGELVKHFEFNYELREVNQVSLVFKEKEGLKLQVLLGPRETYTYHKEIKENVVLLFTFGSLSKEVICPEETTELGEIIKKASRDLKLELVLK